MADDLQPDPKHQPIKLGEITWQRNQAFEPQIQLVNRYYEENPTNMVEQAALLTRPAITRRTNVGPGPVRYVFEQDGTFDNDLFVVSGLNLYRVHKEYGQPDVVTLIEDCEIQGNGTPSIVATEENFLFIADGFQLQVYDGSDDSVTVIDTPDDIPIISLTYIGGFVICVQNASQRFYWIRPAEKVIDPLDFAEAERTPDWILQAQTFGDQFFLFGTKTTEVWYLSGDALAPFARVQGRLYDRGIWGGTSLKVGDLIIVVGEDGIVYSIENGPQRISYYGLEERIRRAMKIQDQEL